MQIALIDGRAATSPIEVSMNSIDNSNLLITSEEP